MAGTSHQIAAWTSVASQNISRGCERRPSTKMETWSIGRRARMKDEHFPEQPRPGLAGMDLGFAQKMRPTNESRALSGFSLVGKRPRARLKPEGGRGRNGFTLRGRYPGF